MNGGDMDVYLTSNRIHYLCEESIQKYSTLKFKTKQGELVMMNPTILAALNSTLVHSLGDLDHEECCVITQFTREDLEEIKNFSWTGTRPMNPDIFIALGINSNNVFEPRPKAKFENIQVKVEPSTLLEDFAASSIAAVSGLGSSYNDTKKYDTRNQTTTENFYQEPKEEIPDSGDYDFGYFDDIPDNSATDNDWTYGTRQPTTKRQYRKRDESWTPDKKSRLGRTDSYSRAVSTAQLTQEQQEMFDKFELPKPIDEFKMPPSKGINRKSHIGTDKPFACSHCSTNFTTEKILQDHMIKMHSDHFKCHLCPKIFALEQSEDLKLHMFKHEMKLLSNRKIECVQCGNFFGRPNKYEEHIQKKGPSHNDQCAQCSRKFLTHEEYKTHVVDEHYGKWKYKCGHCEETFDEKKELKHHSFIHPEASVETVPVPSLPKPPAKKKKSAPVRKICPECGLNVYNLTNHMIGVHGNQQHTCPHCQLILKTKARLQKHIEWIHEKAPCEQCGEMVGIAKMQRHVASKHTSIYDKRFKCDVCGKSFNENARLKDHKNVHTGEKPYKCKFCNACFASSGTHAMHQRSHLGHRRTK